MDNREVINDVLVNLFNEILRLEEEAIITDKYKDISNNDMHIIEAVGLGGGNMSSIALTNKGRMAYHHHAEFHRQMTEAVIAELNENETDVLVKALDGLRKFFRQYHEQ